MRLLRLHPRWGWAGRRLKSRTNMYCRLGVSGQDLTSIPLPFLMQFEYHTPPRQQAQRISSPPCILQSSSEKAKEAKEALSSIQPNLFGDEFESNQGPQPSPSPLLSFPELAYDCSFILDSETYSAIPSRISIQYPSQPTYLCKLDVQFPQYPKRQEKSSLTSSPKPMIWKFFL